MLDGQRFAVCSPFQGRAIAERDKALQRDFADKLLPVTDKVALRQVGPDKAFHRRLGCFHAVNPHKVVADNPKNRCFHHLDMAASL